jgi:protein-S-isoprenylcysteine O-methyltransferase Ste14
VHQTDWTLARKAYEWLLRSRLALVVFEILEDKSGLGSEFPYCDSLQLGMMIMFFVVWGLDSFVFGYSTVLAGLVPLPLRLFLAVLPLSVGVYFGAKSHEMMFGEERHRPVLIDSGVYSRVRHPMYLGILMFCLGFFFIIPSLLSLGVWVAFFILYDRMAAYEENDLVRLLGDEYTAYQKRVPKWLIRLRTKS